MNRSFAVLALALCLPFTARADDATQHARAQELVTMLHSDRMIAQLSSAILKQVSDAAQQATGANATPENQARLTDFNKKISDMVGTQLSWNVMGPQIVDVYAKAFTEEELTGIVSFYKTPAGTAFLTKAPQVNQQLQQLAQPKLAALQTQVRDAFEEFRKSLATGAPSGPPTLNTLPPASGSAPATAPAPSTAPATKPTVPSTTPGK
jgi:hypothetical protein